MIFLKKEEDQDDLEKQIDSNELPSLTPQDWLMLEMDIIMRLVN